MMSPEPLDVLQLARDLVRQLPDSDPLYDLALDTAIADDQVASFTRAGRPDAAANWAAHRDERAAALRAALDARGPLS